MSTKLQNDGHEVYGELIRKIRLDKRQSLEEISEGIMSYSLLSKFERGETMLTIDKFFKILDKLNIGFDEFELMLNGYQDNPVKMFFSIIKYYYKNKDVCKLKEKMTDEMKEFKLSGDKKNKLNYIVIYILLDSLEEEEEVPQAYLTELSDYLFSIEDWTQYELLLYSHAIEKLNIQIVLLFSKELLGKLEIYTENIELKKIVIKAILNTILKCLKYDFLEDAHFFMEAIEKVLTDDFLWEKSILYYIKGRYYMLIGDESTGKFMMDEALNIMKHFDDTQIEDYVKGFFII
ncbi:MAG: helix-turn-helix domain-containing protein [Carnobacterium maltaromaticum]